MMRDMPKTGLHAFEGPAPGRPIGRFLKAFKAAVTKADIGRKEKPVRLAPRVPCKAYATWRAERGVAESVLQSPMGHAKGPPRSARHFYVHATEGAKKAAVLTLPTRGKNAM